MIHLKRKYKEKIINRIFFKVNCHLLDKALDPRYSNLSLVTSTGVETQFGGVTFLDSEVPSVWSLLGYMNNPLVSESRKDLLLEYCLISQQNDARIKNIYGQNTCDNLQLPTMKKKKRKQERKQKKNRYTELVFVMIH